MSRPPVSTGALLRDIQHATTHMKKARKLLTELRGGSADEEKWAKAADLALVAVKDAARLVANVSPELAEPDTLLKLVQMQRFATGLLVKVRRVKSALSREDGLRELTGTGTDLEADDWSDDE
jgi:hypothetical protein